MQQEQDYAGQEEEEDEECSAYIQSIDTFGQV
jgi:hypothetical protein